MQLISSDLRELLQPVNARSVIYAALTTAFLGLTISYIVAPVSMLTSILQGASTPECIALGRGVGAALLVLPTWTVNLKVFTPSMDNTAAAQKCATYMCGGKPAHSMSSGHMVWWPLRACCIEGLSQELIVYLPVPIWYLRVPWHARDWKYGSTSPLLC